VQRGHRDIGAGVGVVDRVDLVAGDEHLRRVELPAEEGVDDPADRHGSRSAADSERKSWTRHTGRAWACRAEVDDHRLGADRERARELLVLDGRLQVHEHLAGLVVGPVQLVSFSIRETPRQPPPSKGFM
jgi:hypothetical protein